MNRRDIHSNQLLLEASLVAGDRARAAFQAWQSVTDLNTLPFGQYELLPVLYRNLVRQGIDPAWIGRLRGIYRKAWYQHQTGYGAAMELRSALTSGGDGPPVCDTAVILSEPSETKRPRHTISLMIPPIQAPYALRWAIRQGYIRVSAPLQIDRDDFFIWRSSLLVQTNRGIPLLIRWHFLDHRPSTDIDELFFSRTRPFPHAGEKRVSLDSTASLLMALSSGGSSSVELMDAGLIVLHHDDIDWPWLISTAKKAVILRRVLTTLTLLTEILKDRIPEDILQGLPENDATPLESEPKHSCRHPIGRHWKQFHRLATAHKVQPTVFAFYAYLQHTWGKARLFDMMPHAVGRIAASITQQIRRRLS